MLNYQIIIVGAGPAGLSTGLHLARSAPDLAEPTLILEREHHPRPKLCAGGVLPGAQVCLRELGLDVSAVPSTAVHEIRLVLDGRSTIIRREPACFRVVQRQAFDAWLAEETRARGLAIEEDVRVRGARRLGGVWDVYTDRGSYRARVLVGADGANSVVRRTIFRERVRQLARVIEVRLPADERVEDAGRATMDFSCMAEGVQGYAWDFPAAGDGRPMRNWGAYDSHVHRRASRGSLRAALEKAAARAGRQLDPAGLEGHPVRWFNHRAALSMPGVLLVGDAAGTDPAVGEGISFALGYGEVAAAAVQDAFARGDYSFRDYRERVMGHRVGRYLKRRAAGAYLLCGLGAKRLVRWIWPLVGWIAQSFFIDWDWGQESTRRGSRSGRAGGAEWASGAIRWSPDPTGQPGTGVPRQEQTNS